MSSSFQISESLSSSEILCSNLAQGIHAMAQPLAVLMASLGKAHTDLMNLDELRELTARSAAQVERACSLFGCLQQLVMAESIKPQLSPTLLLPVLAYAVEGVDVLFQEDGISLRLVALDSCPPVLIHRARTLQALSQVLLIFHGLSHPQDTVELVATQSANAVEVVVRNPNVSVAAINAESSLSMAVAEANMRSQQAKFALSLSPFTVSIELPKAPFAY
jgi:hypothetical protein